jgi:hypothetical protein
MALFRMVAQVSHRNVSRLVARRARRDAGCPASNGPARRSGGVHRVGDGFNEAKAEIRGPVAQGMAISWPKVITDKGGILALS